MAYRFNGTSDKVEFSIAPFTGFSFGASGATVACYLKRTTLGTFDWPLIYTTSGGSEVLGFLITNTNALQLVVATAATSPFSINNSSTWYLIAATFPGGSSTVRFHVHDGTSWSHQNGGTVNSGFVYASTDRLAIGDKPTSTDAPFVGDFVCAGIKKGNSTDLQIETLSRTAFSAWRSFAFDWLIGFDASLEAAGILQDQASPGTGDEIAISGTTAVSDPPGWLWAAPPVLTRPATNYIAGTGITVAAVDNPSLDAVDVTIASTVTGLPTVVNGQWVKGVGGVPVWAAINVADVGNVWGSGLHAARPAATAATAGMIYVATDRGGAWLSNGAGGWLLIGQTPYYVSASQFPASPYDGEEVFWVDAAANPSFEFHCRYQAASTSPYKWEVIGSSGPYVVTAGSITPVGDGAWHILVQAGFVRAIEFVIRPHYFFVAAGTAGTSYQGWVGWGTNSVFSSHVGATTVWGQVWNLVAGSDAIGTVAANQVIQSFYLMTIGSTGANCVGSMSIWPRRVA